MPLTADGCLVDQTPLSIQSVDMTQHAPPLYGEHVLDQLYAGVDQAGIMTPAPQSGMNTPFYSQSRAGSSENLASMDVDSHPNGAVPPAALSSRLQNLNTGSRNNSFRRLPHHAASGANTPHHQNHNENDTGYFDQNNHSGQNSNPLSRRVSEEENQGGVSNMTSGQHTPEHIDYSDLGDLTKVPSYRTAVKAPIRGMSYNDVLPNYDAAISAPPSPVRTFSGPTTTGPDNSTNGINARTNGVASLGFTPIHPPPPAHMPTHIGDGDERRRLHVLQNRGRAH
jgi:hypothetical protein